MRFPKWLPVYGDTSYRGNCRSEECEQIDFVSHLEKHYPQYAAVMIHPKNEGRRTHNAAERDRRTGSLNTGASDIIIPSSPTFVCELKRKDHTKSKWQPGQLDYLKAAHDNGCFVSVALGYEAALEAIAQWHKERGF